MGFLGFFRRHFTEETMGKRLQSILAVGLLSLSLWLGMVACAPTPPNRFEQAQQESSAKGAKAVAPDSTQGSEFNRFFPAPSGDFERVYSQEKKGFAEAKLKQGGKEVAMLAIADLANNPAALEKFKASTTSIGGFPSVSQGSTATAILVGDRYQVKVLSRAPTFTATDRQDWLERFNLKGLAQLK